MRSKYFSSKDQNMLKIAIVPTIAVTGVHAFLLLETFSMEEIAWIRKEMLKPFFQMSDQNLTVFVWMICVTDNMAYIANAAGQIVITVLRYLTSLAICFKRIRQHLPQAEIVQKCAQPGEKLHSVITVLLEDHLTLCATVDRISARSSVLLLLYTCIDILKIFDIIQTTKPGQMPSNLGFSDLLGAFWSFIGVSWLHTALRTAALVYLSDQVCHRRHLKCLPI